MKLSKIHTANLTLNTGETIRVEQIGKGHYSTAWANCTNVYVQTNSEDNAKELLCNIAHLPHLPEVCQLSAEYSRKLIDAGICTPHRSTY